MVRAKTNLKVVAAPSTTLQALADDYVAEKRADGLSPHSIDMLRTTLRNKGNGFLVWCAQRDITEAGQLNDTVLQELSRYLLEEHRTKEGRPLARESVRTYLRTLRGFIRWAERQGEVGTVAIPKVKAEERTVQVLTRAEITEMVGAATSERDKLIIRLLADTGIRLGELLALRPEDLIRNGDYRFLHVRGKGARQRNVAIVPQLFSRLERYTRRPQAREASSERLFLTDRKHNGGYGALSGRTLQQMLRFTAEAAGIKKRVHPHLFRHSAITWMVNSNVPVDHIRRLVGHADLSLITGVYAHSLPTDVYESVLALIRKDDEERRR